MANKATLKARVTPEPQEKDFLRVPVIPLSFDDRTALREMFASTAFKRAWHNASLGAPSCLPMDTRLETALGPSVAINQLNRQQGWEMFKAALLRQCDDPTPPRVQAEEKYSATGLEIVDLLRVEKPRLAFAAPVVKKSK